MYLIFQFCLSRRCIYHCSLVFGGSSCSCCCWWWWWCFCHRRRCHRHGTTTVRSVIYAKFRFTKKKTWVNLHLFRFCRKKELFMFALFVIVPSTKCWLWWIYLRGNCKNPILENPHTVCGICMQFADFLGFLCWFFVFATLKNCNQSNWYKKQSTHTHIIILQHRNCIANWFSILWRL